jgi:putative ATPase
MEDLFSAAGQPHDGPLADRMRPRTLDELIGQDHIVGSGRLLRRAIQADRLSSLIFYGPPGTGKTSLARVIANNTKSAFENLNAVLSGIKDIREAIDRSGERRRLYGKRTILFVDEVHRWNKAQQDALLPWVENGTVILIGATTENPFFEVNRALVSRSRIFRLRGLEAPDLMEAARRALGDRERGYGKWQIRFEAGALEHLVEVASGDVRSLLNALELAVETSLWTLEDREGKTWPPPEGAQIRISMETAEESIQRRAVLYDRDGDYHFDTISAFIKSLRGSDPDAALYWLAKMVRAGEDPAFIFRRMIILASEDVGLADPQALEVVIACAESFDRIGFPEGNFPLAHACLYLATAPKSNSAMAFFDALAEVDREDAEVPGHLKDPSRDAESFGHGKGYIYPHAYRDHWAAQQYLPSALRGRIFYTPSTQGREGKIREQVLSRRELQAAIVFGEGEESAEGELLSWSPSGKGREGWFKRLERGRSAALLRDRDAIFEELEVARHHRILIPLAADGLLLWEALRRVPEGLAAALVSSESAKETLEAFNAPPEGIEKPLIAVMPRDQGLLPSKTNAKEWFGAGVFDHIALREPWRRGFNASPENFASFAEKAAALLAPGGKAAILASPPARGERISRILEKSPLPRELLGSLKKAEDSLFRGRRAGFWEEADMTGALEKEGFTVYAGLLDQAEERRILPGDLELWFNRENPRWGAFMYETLGEKAFLTLKETLEDLISRGPVLWQWQSILFRAQKA